MTLSQRELEYFEHFRLHSGGLPLDDKKALAMFKAMKAYAEAGHSKDGDISVGSRFEGNEKLS